MVTVLCDGKVIEMTPEAAKRRGVLGGAQWDAEHDEYETLKTYRAVVTEMGMDGVAFQGKIADRDKRIVFAALSGDEVTFSELFEQQEYWA